MMFGGHIWDVFALVVGGGEDIHYRIIAVSQGARGIILKFCNTSQHILVVVQLHVHPSGSK